MTKTEKAKFEGFVSGFRLASKLAHKENGRDILKQLEGRILNDAKT